MIDQESKLDATAVRDLDDLVTGIQGHACLLEDSHDLSDATRQRATEIRIAAERATRLTRQLLTQPTASPAAEVRAGVAAVASSPPPARASKPSPPSSVLVVDDDPTLRRMLTRLLKRAAFDVVDVETGRRALAALEAKRFDVIVSDIHMPDGDGLELLRSVRRIDLDIPVILMSGKPDVESAATALELGAFRYLTKPLAADEVEKIVCTAARAHALARVRREAMTLVGGEPGAADRAGLEVTERESLMTTPALIARLEQLRGLGFRLAVDDIGAGYSGLTSFTDLTPEIVKLDMALVRSIHVSTVKQRTVGALCRLCHEMGTLVVGEGVETAAERDCLLAIGCDLLQGYLIGRPSNELPAR